MASNEAAFLTGPKARPLQVGSAPMHVPGPHELLIAIRAVAINPADVGVQTLGILAETYPFVLGADGAGVVEAVGSEVTRFKKGDRRFALTQETVTGLVPDGVAFEDAAVLPLGLCTAAAGLFQADGLGLPLPNLKPVQKEDVVLVWGGASSVGACAIQLVRAAGNRVAAVASSRFHELCKELGAEFVFDYKDENMVDDIVRALKGVRFAGAYEATATDATLLQCAQVAARLDGNRFVATANPPFRPLPQLPEGVKAGPVISGSVISNEVGPHIFGEWMTRALETGQLQCKPGKAVAGRGLEGMQAAIDQYAQGISAQKIVVTLE